MKDMSNMVVNQKEITTSLLDAFDFLKSPKDSIKVTGGIKVISRLQENEEEKTLQYILKRLVRSLGANVPDMRMGHFATLVNILTTFNQITVTHLLDLLKKELHASGSSKSEVGDVALGQILVCCAVFRSGLMLKSTDDQQKEVMHTLQIATSKKSYLRTLATLVLIDFVDKLNEEQFDTIVWSTVKQEYKKDLKEYSLDSLYFLLVVSAKFPQRVKLRKLIGVPEVLHEDHIPDICEKLMAGVDFNTINHPVYKEIGVLISKSPHVQLFWDKIDGYLVKHNRNRELVSLNMLNTILLNLQDNVEIIPDLLSDNFFKLFMDWFKGLQTASKIRNKRDDEDNNKIMIKKQKEVLTALAKALKLPSVNSKIRLKTLKKLLLYPGEINFTEITGSTVVKSTIVDLDEEGLKTLAKTLKKVIFNTSKKVVKENVERSWYNNEKVKASELLSYIVSHDAVKDDLNFKITYMQMLMCFGFFKIGGDDNIAVSSELAGSIKTSFYRCFSTRFSNVDNLLAVLSSLISFISTIMEKDKVREKLEKQFPKENMDCWIMVTDICKKLEKNKCKSKVDKVFLILLYQLGLFLFSEPTHVKIARSAIIELKSCYEHYKRSKEKTKIKAKNSLISTDEPEWVEVMVEVLLSILSIDSSVFRLIVQCVFRLLWEYLTPSSISQILSVLDPDDEANPLTEDSDSEHEDNDVSDEEGVTENNNSESKVEQNGDVSDESDSEIEDPDADIKIPDQLRIAVQKALGTAAAAETDTESLDADMISEEEGKNLDEALAEAFRQYNENKNKKSKKDRKNKKSLADFRVRVLDLIDIYLEKDPALDICLNMIAPLTRCLEFCMQDNQFKELENRIRKTIKNLTKIKKFTSTGEVTVGILQDFLKSIVNKGDRSHFMYQALGDVITYFATFIIHCSQKFDVDVLQLSKEQNDLSPILDTFNDLVDKYFHNRNCFLPIIFFHNILQIDWNGKYKLIPVIIKNVFDNNVRHFRRNEGLNLIIGFYQMLNRCKPSSKVILTEISNIEKCFYNAFTEAFNSGNKIEIKSNFLVTIKKLLNVMRMFYDNCKIKTKLDFQSMVDSLTSKSTIKIKCNGDLMNKKSVKTKKVKRKIVQNSCNQSEPKTKKSKSNTSVTD